MKENNHRNHRNRQLPSALALLFGASAGFVNGFFGTGAGILLILSAPLAEKVKNGEIPEFKDRLAETVSVTMVLSIGSAIQYGIKGNLPLGDTLPYLLPAAVGGICGARFMNAISTNLLKKLFASLMILAGLLMIVR